MKMYSDKTVFEAAQERVSYVFDECEEVIVAMSGGKDSTVCMELAIAEAKKRGRLPVKACFIDQEAEWGGTIAYMERLAARPEVDLWWIQIPFTIDNASSYFNDTMIAWGEGQEWMRSKADCAHKDPAEFGQYHDLKEPLNDFYFMFKAVVPIVAGKKPYGFLYGMRSEESPGRRYAMMSMKGKYKDKSWTVCHEGSNYRFGPIYDWGARDVWAAISKNGWDYNHVYDLQFGFGIKPEKMRVSSLVHGIASEHSLKMLQEIEPETYEALVRRMPGVATFGHLQGDIRVRKLPPLFTTWKEYMAYLLENLVDDHAKAAFTKLFTGRDARGMPDTEEKWRLFTGMILANDYLGVRMRNIASTSRIKTAKDIENGKAD